METTLGALSTSFSKNTPNNAITPVIRYTTTISHGIPLKESGKWRPLYDKFSLISERIKTFQNWPYSLQLRKWDLVKSGFYHTKEGDKVTCFYCGVTVSHWSNIGNVNLEHRTHSPSCLYLQMVYDAIPSQNLGYDICHTKVPFALGESIWEKEWIPDNVGMIRYQDRLKTFQYWPIQMRQIPTDLAKSGFYYTGQGDKVTCFHCGITVLNWEFSDIVNIEHKKHSIHCKFVNMVYDF